LGFVDNSWVLVVRRYEIVDFDADIYRRIYTLQTIGEFLFSQFI
jgi:hypothetical protein